MIRKFLYYFDLKDIFNCKSGFCYLFLNSLNGIPTELVKVMLQWEANSCNVILKNITIVQTEDRELMEELIRENNINKYRINDLSCAFEINPDTSSKIKGEIEKKEYYCKLL